MKSAAAMAFAAAGILSTPRPVRSWSGPAWSRESSEQNDARRAKRKQERQNRKQGRRGRK